MSEKKSIDNVKLGILVLSGVLFLVFTLYMIGKNQNIFGASIVITAVTDNTNGLVPGNNVRFKGMNVGTVKSVEMYNDSLINIDLYLRKRMQPFVRKNALITIGTDGLMGNKVLHIIPQEEYAEVVEEGDILYPSPKLDMDDMLNRLGNTSDYFERTVINLYEITNKLNKSESLWKLLSDSVITDDVRLAIRELRITGSRASETVEAAKRLIVSFEKGKGLMQTLFTDTLLVNDLSASMENIQQASSHALEISKEVKFLIQELEAGQGSAGLILRDSTLRQSMMNTMIQLEESSEKLNVNIEAMRSNFLFRRYFRRLEKNKEKKNAKDKTKNRTKIGFKKPVNPI